MFSGPAVGYSSKSCEKLLRRVSPTSKLLRELVTLFSFRAMAELRRVTTTAAASATFQLWRKVSRTPSKRTPQLHGHHTSVPHGDLCNQFLCASLAPAAATIIEAPRLVGIEGRVGRCPCRSLACQLSPRAPERLVLVSAIRPPTPTISGNILPHTLPISTPTPCRFALRLLHSPSSVQSVSEVQSRLKRPYSTRDRPFSDSRSSCPAGHLARRECPG